MAKLLTIYSDDIVDRFWQFAVPDTRAEIWLVLMRGSGDLVQNLTRLNPNGSGPSLDPNYKSDCNLAAG